MNVFCTLGSKSFRPIPLESKWIIHPPRTLWRPIGKPQSLMYHICSSFRLGTFLIFTMEMTNKNRSPQSVNSCLGSSYPPRRSAWGNGVSSLPETAYDTLFTWSYWSPVRWGKQRLLLVFDNWNSASDLPEVMCSSSQPVFFTQLFPSCELQSIFGLEEKMRLK